MNHEKTFSAIKKLQEVEIELHRLKNLLEIANKALGAKRTWVEMTNEEIATASHGYTEQEGFVHGAIWALDKLKEKNT